MSRDENHCHKSMVCFSKQSVLNSGAIRPGRGPGSCHRAAPKARRWSWQLSRPAPWRRGRVWSFTLALVGPAIAAASHGASPRTGRWEGQRGRRRGARHGGCGDDSETDREPRRQERRAYYAETAGVPGSPSRIGTYGSESPREANGDQDAATGPVSQLSRPMSRTTWRSVIRHQSRYTKRSP